MANFPIPYLYKNPAFWGDTRDNYYGIDFVGLPYQDKNNTNEKEQVLQKMNSYIGYIKGKEQALMSALGILDLEAPTFHIEESTKMKDQMKALGENLRNLQLQIKDENIDSYKKTSLRSIQNITNSTSVKTVSKFILKNLFSKTNKQMPIDDFLKETLDPIQIILSQPNKQKGKQWEYFLETQTKLLSYIIDFFKSPEIENFKHTAWYQNYYKIVQDAEQFLKKAKIKRDTKALVGIKTDKTKFTIDSSTSDVTVNLTPLLTSVSQSLTSFHKKGFANMVETAIADGLFAEHAGGKGFSGGKVYTTQIVFKTPEITISDDHSPEEQKLIENSKLISSEIQKNLAKALRGRRTVKTDVLLELEGTNYGLSVKTGQKENTKIDTRSNYYTFINFITQYSPEIADALLQPQNQHILINMVANDGTFHSNSLDYALNMIAYAFFGANSDTAINNQTEYFNDISKKYSENVIIINEDGLCTRVSAYLTQIYNAIEKNVQRQNMLYSVRTTFKGAPKESFLGPPPPHPHPAESQLLEGATYLKDIAVETYIKTFH